MVRGLWQQLPSLKRIMWGGGGEWQNLGAEGMLVKEGSGPKSFHSTCGTEFITVLLRANSVSEPLHKGALNQHHRVENRQKGLSWNAPR